MCFRAIAVLDQENGMLKAYILLRSVLRKVLAREKESWDNLASCSENIYPFLPATIGMYFFTSLMLGFAT